ncbi:general transcription factor II-I repeat domain-containing protein 2A-like [Macrobrachium nipponense]|uniref:general transcription factor II-I repeat domain-containing protein 2A-like n=1 Tax=Macrobrachium nipponense TaxID=159736 RepID=UPI0030C80DAA
MCILLAAQKLSPDVLKKFENISLNRMTVQRRIVDLSGDIVDQLKEKIIELDLDKLVGISTDGAPAMIGKQNGLLQLLIKHLGERKYELKQFHCIIHQQILCGKELDFDHVMKVVVSTVYFINSRSALHHRLYKQFLDEIEAEYGDLVFFTQVRWLSRGNTLKRFISLLDEIEIFLNEKNKMVPELTNADWLCDLSFLVDLTSHLNNLNHKLQGNNQLISQLANYVTAFEQKLKLLQLRIVKGELRHFPN